MTNPKTQGGNYEREIASLLSLWYTKNKRDDIFYRSHSSGGRATNRKKAGKELEGQYGDICATDPSGKPLIDAWVCECKHGYGEKLKVKVGKKIKTFDRQWCLLDMLDSEQKVSVLIKLWRLAKKEARDAGRGKESILIMQRARRASIIAMTKKEFNLWCWHTMQQTMKENFPTHIIVNRKGLAPIVLMRLASFFEWTQNVVVNRFKQ